MSHLSNVGKFGNKEKEKNSGRRLFRHNGSNFPFAGLEEYKMTVEVFNEE